MPTHYCRLLMLIQIGFFSIVLSGCSIDVLRDKIKSAVTSDNDKNAIGVSAERLDELDQAAYSYADRFVTTISDASDRGAKAHPTKEAKEESLRLKLHNSTSIYAIASGPNPLGKLLDMLTMVTLNKINMIDEGRAQRIFGSSHELIERAYYAAHDDIWGVARRFLKPNEMENVRQVIKEWRLKHPNVMLLSYVRFDDFARARAGLKQDNPAIGGLFDKINEVNRTVESAQAFGERTFFYFQRMPRLLQWQTERTVDAVFDRGNLQNLQHSVQQISRSVDIFANEIRRLDKHEAAVQKHLEEVNRIVGQMKQLVPDVRLTVQDGEKLLLAAKNTSDSLGNTLQIADKAAAPFRPDPNALKSVDTKPFDINEYTRTVQEVNKTVMEVNSLVSSLQGGDINGKAAGLQQLAGNLIGNQVDHIALRLGQLALLIFLLALLYRFIVIKTLKPAKILMR